MAGEVLLNREGFIATVTLSHPEKRNALTLKMWRRLGAIFSELSHDDTVRCVVLRGAGMAFASGTDISTFEKERYDIAPARSFGEIAMKSIEAIAECPHPIVALIEGACVGGGLEIAALCDMRICGRSARFGILARNHGLRVGITELPSLLAIAGLPNTLEILLEGRIFDADEAQRKGLVNRVLPDDALEAAAYETAHRIANGAPLLARWHKNFVKRLLHDPALKVADIEQSYVCFGAEDFELGYRAFLKAKPKFVGR
jgi:enoyl-CoA hydratase/carnithine racemase